MVAKLHVVVVVDKVVREVVMQCAKMIVLQDAKLLAIVYVVILA